MKSLHIGELKIPIPSFQGGMGIGIYSPGVISAVADISSVNAIPSEIEEYNKLKTNL